MAEQFDKIESYTDKPYITPNDSSSYPKDAMYKADRNASLDQITTYIYESLLDFQGQWQPSNRGTTCIALPNARYLAVGDRISNTTQGTTYIISSVITATDYLPDPTNPWDSNGIVSLNTMGAAMPVTNDILALEEKNTVDFQSSYSRIYQQRPVNDWRDTIVYRVKRREPGTVGHHAFEPPVEAKPRVRESMNDPDHPGLHIQVLGQWFDNIIQFDCWSKYNNRADDLIDWFEDFMFKYTWVWKKNGVNEILYWMRTIDTESSEWRNDLAVRTVNYYFRTEKLVTINEYDFRQINMYLSMGIPYPSGYFSAYKPIPEAWPSGYVQVMDEGFKNFSIN